MSSQNGGIGESTRFMQPIAPQPQASGALGTTRFLGVPVHRSRVSRPDSPAPRLVPKMGMRAGLYRFARHIAPGLQPPKLSEKESRHVLRKEWTERLREVSDQCPTATVAFVNAKGGAATTTTLVHVASLLAELMRIDPLVADFNPASGTAAIRLGKDFDQTITIRELRELLPQIENMSTSEVRRLFRPTSYGTRVLSANDIKRDTSELFGTHAAQMIEVLQRHFEYVMLDTANELSDASARAVLKTADVIVFTANVGVKDSLRKLGESMQSLRLQGLQDKVNGGVVVISNLPKGKTPRDYEDYLSQVKLDGTIAEKYNFDGPLLGIPADPLLALDVEVNLEGLSWESFQAYLELTVTILEQAFNAQAGVKP
jgi:cellulose biosynthesis protein BcsQ